MSEQLTDAQLKELALKQYNAETVKKNNFPTEIVPLPSKGKLYPKDHPLASGQIEIKYMTAKEEDILTSQNLIKQGAVLDKLLESLIVTQFNYDDLYVGDKNALLVAARILGYGKDYTVEVEDPFSGSKQKVTIDLTEIEDKEIDEEKLPEHENYFVFTLPNSKREIAFKLLTHKIDKEIKESLKAQMKKNKSNIDREFTTRLKNVIISVDGKAEQSYINNFVDNELFSLDSLALRNYIQEVSPDVDLSFVFTSEETGDSMVMQVPMTTEFFWPRA
jgi:hypothetical protein